MNHIQNFSHHLLIRPLPVCVLNGDGAAFRLRVLYLGEKLLKGGSRIPDGGLVTIYRLAVSHQDAALGIERIIAPVKFNAAVPGHVHQQRHQASKVRRIVNRHAVGAFRDAMVIGLELRRWSLKRRAKVRTIHAHVA